MSLRRERTPPKSTGCTLQLRFEKRPNLSCISRETSMSLRRERTKSKIHKQEADYEVISCPSRRDSME